MVNAWMNTPTGLTMRGGQIVAIDPIAGMFNPSTFQQALHMLLASYAATGFAVAGHSRRVRAASGRDATFHRHAMMLALLDRRAGGGVAAAVGRLQRTHGRAVGSRSSSPRSKASSRRSAARRCASVVGPTRTRDARDSRSKFRDGLSLLAFHDPNAEVKGLDARLLATCGRRFAPVHLGFQIMVGLGTAMALVSA